MNSLAGASARPDSMTRARVRLVQFNLAIRRHDHTAAARPSGDCRYKVDHSANLNRVYRSNVVNMDHPGWHVNRLGMDRQRSMT